MYNQHSGWGLPNQNPKDIVKQEQETFDKLAKAMPAKMMRAPAKEPKNQELVNKILELQKQDGIEEGFSFLHLEKAIFGKELPYKQQLIGSCIASGGRIADTGRMLAEVFLFNEEQDLMGNLFDTVSSFQPFAPFSYRAGRKFAGINGGRSNGSDDGSFCSAHIRGKMEIGFLGCSAKDLKSDDFPEPQNETTYRQWGADDRLMTQFTPQVIAKLTESEKVEDINELSEVVIQHIKPLQIASLWAFEAGQKHQTWTWGGQPVYIYKRSREQWAHNMTIYGLVKVSGKWYAIIVNTWGEVHNGRRWFAIPIEVMDQWLKDRDTEAMTIGNIEFSGKPETIF